MGRKKQELWVRLMVLLTNGGRCVYCDYAESQVIDHVIPLKANGEDSWENLVPACEACNLGKSDKGLFAWVAELTYRDSASASGARPHGTNGLDWMREQLECAFDDVQARLVGVKAELDDEGRRNWFFDRHWHLSKNAEIWLWRGWADTDAAEARMNGYPKLPPPPPPPRMRITRAHLGQVLEPIPSDEAS
ncbi:HNH endonuclease [Streptomyces avermitilis]|uniref:HNH endonuclease n=1 Tax=Streptomyces avermitilis TaxID=33903 RepID=UPI00381F8ED0